MVRCADCGFLAVRNKRNLELHQVTAEIRHTWIIPVAPGDTYVMLDEKPICFVQAANLADETKRMEGPATDTGKRLAVVQRGRECGRFTTWLQDYSPKEHHAMVLESQLMLAQQDREEKDREYRDRQLREEREHRDRQREMDLEHRREDVERERKRDEAEKGRFRWQLIVVGIIGTVVLAVAQILGSLIQAGILFPQQPQAPARPVTLPDVQVLPPMPPVEQ